MKQNTAQVGWTDETTELARDYFDYVAMQHAEMLNPKHSAIRSFVQFYLIDIFAKVAIDQDRVYSKICQQLGLSEADSKTGLCDPNWQKIADSARQNGQGQLVARIEQCIKDEERINTAARVSNIDLTKNSVRKMLQALKSVKR